MKFRFNKNLFSGYILAGLPILFSVWTVSIIARDLGVKGRGEIVVLTLFAALWGTASGLGIPWASRELGTSKFSIDQLWWRATLFISALMTIASILIGLSVFGTSHEHLISILILLIVNSLTSVRTFQAAMIMQKYGTWINSVLGIIAQLIFVVSIELFDHFGALTISWVLLFQAVTLLVPIAGGAVLTKKIEIPVPRKSTFDLEHSKVLLDAFFRQAKDALLSKIDILLLVLVSTSYRGIGLYSIAGVLFQLSYQITNQALYSSYSELMAPLVRLRYALWRSLIPVFTICFFAILTSNLWIPVLFGVEFLAAQTLLIPVTVGCIGLTIWILTNALNQRQRHYVFPIQIIFSIGAVFMIQTISKSLEITVWGIGVILLLIASHDLFRMLRKYEL